jgi:AAA15 family ATPase/GTPase
MQKIIVKNFGPIKEAEIALNGLTILIGEQASGKSTLAKLIYFFKTLKKDLYDLARYKSASLEDPTNTNAIIQTAIRNIKTKFKQYFGSTDKFAANYYIEFQYSENNKIVLSGKSLNIAFTPQNFFTDIIGSLRVSAPTINRLEQNNDFSGLEVYGARLSEQLDNLFFDKYVPLFIPAGRNITVSYPQEFKDFFLKGISLNNSSKNTIDIELMKLFLRRVAIIQDTFNDRSFQQILDQQMVFNPETTKKIQKAINLIKSVLKGDYSNYGGQSEGIKPTGSRRVIPIQESSSGQQEVLRILQDIYLCLIDAKPVFRVIEEPEAHLFPKAQSQIMQLLSLLVESGDHQLLITTHSPYILSILNNLLFAWKVGNLHLQTDAEFRLNPTNFNAYVLRDGNSNTIFDTTTGLIDRNYLDEIFEEIGFEYDALYEVYADFITSNGSN